MQDLRTGFLAQELYKIFPQAVHVGGQELFISAYLHLYKT
jgi:hypothetical protein